MIPDHGVPGANHKVHFRISVATKRAAISSAAPARFIAGLSELELLQGAGIVLDFRCFPEREDS
jgi:hypothetical protein